MTTDPLAQLVVALVVELRTVVRDEVRAAMQSRAPTEVMSVREAAAFARVGQARIRAWVATGRLARLGTGPVRVRRADVDIDRARGSESRSSWVARACREQLAREASAPCACRAGVCVPEHCADCADGRR